jgi:DNA-binding NtrC family response regulator
MSRDILTTEPSAIKHLMKLEFPGNVRELENMIERAIVVGNGKEIRLKDLPMGDESSANGIESLNELESKHIEKILKKYDWNISRSSRALNIDRVTLYNKIEKYGLQKP